LQVFEGLVSSECFEKLKHAEYLPFAGMERFQNKKNNQLTDC
jgi:hypothetical protein